MAQQGGMGATLKIDVTAVLTVVANLLEVEFPAQKLIVAEATPHAATSGYAVYVSTGKRELSEFKATIGWEKALANHAAILTALGSNSAVNMSIADPAATEVIAFTAFITEVQRVSKQDDSYRAEITIQPTANPTITP